MKIITRIALFALCLSLALPLGAETAFNNKFMLAQANQLNKASQSTYKPSPQELKSYVGGWVYTDKTGAEAKIYRLNLLEDGCAERVIQHSNGIPISLEAGKWFLSRKEQLVLELTPENDENTVVKGTYSAVINNSNKSLVLKPIGKAMQLAPTAKGSAPTFYNENYTPEKMQELCETVLKYYAKNNNEAYPGKVVITDISPEGVSVKLVEDAGSHTSTGGSYLIDPISYLGTDEILGTEIDFADYIYYELPKQKTNSPANTANVSQKANSEGLITEIVYISPVSGGETEPKYSFKLPQIKDNSRDANEFNESMRQLKRDAEQDNCFYDKIGYKSYQNGDILSLVVEYNVQVNMQKEYSTFNYNVAKKKSLSNKELLAYANVSEDLAEKALRKAAAAEFEKTELLGGAFQEGFDSLMIMRAETIGKENIKLDAASLYLDGQSKLHANIFIATPAGAGFYAVDVCLDTAPKAMTYKNVKCGFASAELKNNAVTISFEKTAEASYLFSNNKAKFNTPYPVEGLYGEYTDIALGFMGNGDCLYLFLTDANGAVTVCNVVNCIDLGMRFIAAGPMQGAKDVVSYEQESTDEGQNFYAITKDHKKIDLYDPVLEIENIVSVVLKNSTWNTSDGSYSLSFDENQPTVYWTSKSGTVLASSVVFAYLGTTKEGMHYYVSFGGGAERCLLTQSFCAPGSEGQGSLELTLTQLAGPLLKGVTSSNVAMPLLQVPCMR